MNRKELEGIKVSLNVSTYNRPDALAVVLRSAFWQTRLPDEIIVGDDGSKSDTKAVIDRLRSESPVPLIHVWQEDKGFRLAMMRNKSVAVASGEYIIEVDGDVMLHPKFVMDHLKVARPHHYVKSGRANLNTQITESICAAGEPRIIHWWSRGIKSKPVRCLRIEFVSRLLAPYYRRNQPSALGCNISFYKADFLHINGYDESFEGWGGEDMDLGKRLVYSGVKKLHLKFSALVYHLYHPTLKNTENFKYVYSENSNRPIYCAEGVDKYIKEHNT